MTRFNASNAVFEWVSAGGARPAPLGERAEEPAALAWHEHYIARYRALAERFDRPLLRTDVASAEAALDEITAWARGLVVRDAWKQRAPAPRRALQSSR